MEEFLILARCLEPIRLPKDEAIDLFNRISDKEKVAGEFKRVITFPNFTITCVEHALFSIECQRNFLNATSERECILQLNTIHPRDDRTKIIEERFKQVDKYNGYYQSWVEPIKKAMTEDYSKTANILLIKLKLAEAESIWVYTEYCFCWRNIFLIGSE